MDRKVGGTGAWRLLKPQTPMSGSDLCPMTGVCLTELSRNAGVAIEPRRYLVLGLVSIVVSPANLATESTRISHH